MELLALIFVPPLTDFSKDPDMADEHVAMSSAEQAIYTESLGLRGGIGGLWTFQGGYCAGLNSVIMMFSQWSCAFAEAEYSSSINQKRTC